MEPGVKGVALQGSSPWENETNEQKKNNKKIAMAIWISITIKKN